MLDGVIVGVHPLQVHPADDAEIGGILTDQAEAVQPVEAVHQERLGARAVGARAHGRRKAGERFAAFVQGGDAEKVKRVGRKSIERRLGGGKDTAVIEAVSFCAHVNFVPLRRVAPGVSGDGRMPGKRYPTGAAIPGCNVAGRLGQEVDGDAVAVGKVLDDALVDGPGGKAAEGRLFEVLGVVQGVVESEFQEHAGHGREFAQFAEVGRTHSPVYPARIPEGADVVDEFMVDKILQFGASRGGVGIMDIGFGAAGRAATIADGSVRVPGDIDGILVGLFFPLGIKRPADDVVGVDLRGSALVLGPGETGFLVAWPAACSSAVVYAAHPPADADGVGNDSLAGLLRLIAQGDGTRGAGGEVVGAQIAPGQAVHFLV